MALSRVWMGHRVVLPLCHVHEVHHGVAERGQYQGEPILAVPVQVLPTDRALDPTNLGQVLPVTARSPIRRDPDRADDHPAVMP